jgi:uncharacterized protein YdhG (YjbR/CyaY superfamily)
VDTYYGGSMKKAEKQTETIDDYIASFPKHIQEILEEIRQAIREAAPDAEETISYQMPAFRLNGVLVYFAAFKNHIGFYPTSSGVAAFKAELSQYEVSKGTIRFPLGQPVPFNLIKKIVKYRVEENLDRKKAPPKKQK